MAFEANILEKVAVAVGARVGEFYCGTLFVEDITPADAARIETALQNPAYGVVVTPQGDGEFAFDFV